MSYVIHNEEWQPASSALPQAANAPVCNALFLPVWNQMEFLSDDIVFDFSKMTMKCHGCTRKVRPTECLLLKAFFTCPECLIPRDQLLSLLESVRQKPIADNTLSVYVARLRTALADFDCSDCLQTRQQEGYCWDRPVYCRICPKKQRS